MKYRDSNHHLHDFENDIFQMNFSHTHPLVKQLINQRLKVWCPICDIVFGVILDYNSVLVD